MKTLKVTSLLSIKRHCTLFRAHVRRIFVTAQAKGRLVWLFSGMGLFSLFWFLLRVIPKPSRATYPSQRVAFPIASSFVVWLMAVLGSAAAWRRARRRNISFSLACLWGALALACGFLVVDKLPSLRA